MREVCERPSVRSPGDVLTLLPVAMKRLRREHFYVMALGAGGHVLGVQCVAKGSVDSCPVDPRELFRYAVMKRASGIIVAHNHPSGDATPSDLDLRMTRQLAQGARALGIKLLDHVIIGHGGASYSMLEKGACLDAFREGALAV